MPKLLIKVEQNGLDIAPESFKKVEWFGSCFWNISFSNENSIEVTAGNVRIIIKKIKEE